MKEWINGTLLVWVYGTIIRLGRPHLFKSCTLCKAKTFVNILERDFKLIRKFVNPLISSFVRLFMHLFVRSFVHSLIFFTVKVKP